jgi:hypothetical protein
MKGNHMKTRIYVTGYGQTIRLVSAHTKLQALDYAAKGIINVSAVKKSELPELLQKGIKIEDATGGKTEEIK